MGEVYRVYCTVQQCIGGAVKCRIGDMMCVHVCSEPVLPGRGGEERPTRLLPSTGTLKILVPRRTQVFCIAAIDSGMSSCLVCLCPIHPRIPLTSLPQCLHQTTTTTTPLQAYPSPT